MGETKSLVTMMIFHFLPSLNKVLLGHILRRFRQHLDNGRHAAGRHHRPHDPLPSRPQSNHLERDKTSKLKPSKMNRKQFKDGPYLHLATPMRAQDGLHFGPDGKDRAREDVVDPLPQSVLAGFSGGGLPALAVPVGMEAVRPCGVVEAAPEGLRLIRRHLLGLLLNLGQRFLPELEARVGPRDRVKLLSLVRSSPGGRARLDNQKGAVLPVLGLINVNKPKLKTKSTEKSS